jgi:hypothetical protein
VYGNYTYGRKGNDTLAEFKRRNGFKKMEYPKFYIPLTVRGRVALRVRLHKEWIDVLPAPITTMLLAARAKALHLLMRFDQKKRV